MKIKLIIVTTMPWQRPQVSRLLNDSYLISGCQDNLDNWRGIRGFGPPRDDLVFLQLTEGQTTAKES
ncbi:GL10291 [Drosophila persimilis]|uniref:GL10291 n=1 Tax=Drosophila persimilis TaxID=7234 RepID=B4H9J5_DROPE|nr:GL10291 [Drosophila persimilis]